MKNLVINVFKTLFFFDLAVVVFTLIPSFNSANAAFPVLFKNVIRLLTVAVLTVVFYLFIEKQKPKFRIKAKGRDIVYKIVLGIASGILIPCFASAVFLAFGKMSFPGINPGAVTVLWILALFTEAAYNELLLRGYLFRLYKKHYGFIASSIITTLLFLSMNISLFTAPKLYIANIILFNLALCALVEMTNSVFISVIARFFYTLLSTVLLGSLSLEDDYPHFARTEFSGNSLIFGGAEKIEGSVVVTVLTSAFILLFIVQKYSLVKKLKKFIKRIGK